MSLWLKVLTTWTNNEAGRQVGEKTEKLQMCMSLGFNISVSLLDVSTFEVMFYPSASLGV